MKHYLITGGTGMIGSQLVKAIIQSDAHITILTRQDMTSSHPKISYVNWSQSNWENEIPDIDIVINLAGASLNKRWTKSYKQTIMLSRIQATQALFELFQNRKHKPEVLFNASAVGYYKPDLYRTYTELYKTLPFDFYRKSYINGKEWLANLKRLVRVSLLVGLEWSCLMMAAHYQ